jgi:ABC-type nickel/cobalt efflux system permease component RcnA
MKIITLIARTVRHATIAIRVMNACPAVIAGTRRILKTASPAVNFISAVIVNSASIATLRRTAKDAANALPAVIVPVAKNVGVVGIPIYARAVETALIANPALIA